MWGALSDEKSGFQFLPGIASASILTFDSYGTHEHILLSLFLRLRQPGGPDSCIYFPQEQGSSVIPPGTGSVIAIVQLQVQVMLRPTVRRPVRLGAGPPTGPMNGFEFRLTVTFFLLGVGLPYL
jgi:hypothetical protein